MLLDNINNNYKHNCNINNKNLIILMIYRQLFLIDDKFKYDLPTIVWNISLTLNNILSLKYIFCSRKG